MASTGFYGAIPKKELKARVDTLMNLLSQDVAVPENGDAPGAKVHAAPIPVAVHNPASKTTLALVLGINGALLSLFIPLVGLILSAIAVSSGAAGRKNTNSDRATAGYVLGINGVVLSILTRLLNIIVSVL